MSDFLSVDRLENERKDAYEQLGAEKAAKLRHIAKKKKEADAQALKDYEFAMTEAEAECEKARQAAKVEEEESRKAIEERYQKDYGECVAKYDNLAANELSATPIQKREGKPVVIKAPLTDPRRPLDPQDYVNFFNKAHDACMEYTNKQCNTLSIPFIRVRYPTEPGKLRFLVRCDAFYPTKVYFSLGGTFQEVEAKVDDLVLYYKLLTKWGTRWAESKVNAPGSA